MKRLLLAVLMACLLGKITPGSSNDTYIPTSGTLIVLNKSDATAMLFSLSTGSMLATIATGQGPHEVAVSPDNKIAVVSNYGVREAPGSTLTVIDLKKKIVARTIHLGKYRKPHGLAFLPRSKKVLVTAEAQRALLLVDVQTGKLLRVMDTGQELSHMVVVTPDGDLAFVANIVSGSVSVLDLSRGRRIAIIPTGEGTEGIAISPDRKEVWVGNRAEDTISIIDVSLLRVIKKVGCRSFPIRIKFTPDGKYVLVSNPRSGDVAVFDAHRYQEVQRIPMKLKVGVAKQTRLFGDVFGNSPVPIGLLIHPGGNFAYVANSNADAVVILDLISYKIIHTFKTGRQPDGLGYTVIE